LSAGSRERRRETKVGRSEEKRERAVDGTKRDACKNHVTACPTWTLSHVTKNTPLQTKVERTAAGRYAYTDKYIYIINKYYIYI
jgi:hypothetical protein